MSKSLFFLVFFFLGMTFLASDVDAKKLLPRVNIPKTTSKAATGGSSSQGVLVKVKFRGDRRAIVATFSDLSKASSVTYSLTYDSKGITQGAGGSVSVTEGTVTREILFGTCSHGTCRYDTGITNAKLSVTTTLKNGKKIVKNFKLKV